MNPAGRHSSHPRHPRRPPPQEALFSFSSWPQPRAAASEETTKQRKGRTVPGHRGRKRQHQADVSARPAWPPPKDPDPELPLPAGCPE